MHKNCSDKEGILTVANGKYLALAKGVAAVRTTLKFLEQKNVHWTILKKILNFAFYAHGSSYGETIYALHEPKLVFVSPLAFAALIKV